MRRREYVHPHKRKHISNRHLADRYFYAGEHDTVTRISLTQYNADTLHTREIKTNETSFKKFVDGNSINWFQVSGLTDSEAVTRIVNEFGMHNLDAKDILTPQHVVKIEEYDKHMLIVLNSSYYDTNMEINSEHISILITGNVVISFTESNNPVFENAYKAIESNMLNIRRKNSGLLLAFLLNTIIANLVESASKVEEMLEDIEETLLDIKNDQGNMGLLIQQRRKEYMVIRKNSQPLKEQFAKLEITKLPQLLSEVQRRISIINQKEAFNTNEETKTLINEAMMDIEFTFSKIGQEEMRLISGGVELKEKWQRTISSFTQNFDQDDPEFISLREAFMERFKEHGFVIDTIAKFNEETQALDEIIGRLQDLQKRNNVLLKKYKGDEKFARVHKRIREVNKQREDKGQKPMFSFLDEEIAAILNIIKEDVDAKVYDRNDILKKDAYFGRTVMALINGCLFHFPQIKPEMEDYKFIQTRISQQYINQYNATYGIA